MFAIFPAIRKISSGKKKKKKKLYNKDNNTNNIKKNIYKYR